MTAGNCVRCKRRIARKAGDHWVAAVIADVSSRAPVSRAHVLQCWRGTQMTIKSMKLAAACILVGGFAGWHAPAIAGSDNSSDTYAGDYQGGSLPPGTFIALQYAGFAHSNAFINTAGTQSPNSHANIWEE